jgi:hypothetical protein
MRFDLQAIEKAQNLAILRLASKNWPPNSSDNNDKFFTPGENVYLDELTQEIKLVNTQSSFAFEFAYNAPKQTSVLNNRIISKNQVACCYGIRFMFGEGDAGNTRQYKSYGNLAADNSVYNMELNWKAEQTDFITGQPMRVFFEPNADNNQFSGVYLIRPMRVFTGELAVNNITIAPRSSSFSISGLTFTPNLYMQVSLLIAVGNPSL